MTAILKSLPALLNSLNSSLSSTIEATDKLDSITPPQGGLSLLDTKNELLLSYIQNLVFLILLKIRNAKNENTSDDEATPSQDTIVEKLVELRLYLEKGVHPLEEKLRFQIEKALRAAEDAERATKAAAASAPKKKASKHKSTDYSSSSEDDSSEEDSSDASDSERSTDAHQRTAARPGVSNLNIPRRKPTSAHSDKETKDSSSLPYRPPKNRPLIMPSTNPADHRERAENKDRRFIKSRTMSEYVDSELLPNPQELPSIGTTIADRGRTVKTARQRATEDERRDFEETNLVRLPKANKKEKAAKKREEGRSTSMSFGGEEWRDLDSGLSRISNLAKKGGLGGTRGALERSRKRMRDEDGQRGSGMTDDVKMGERFSKKMKVVDQGGKSWRKGGRLG